LIYFVILNFWCQQLKDPVQSCFIPKTAISDKGIYPIRALVDQSHKVTWQLANMNKIDVC